MAFGRQGKTSVPFLPYWFHVCSFVVHSVVLWFVVKLCLLVKQYLTVVMRVVITCCLLAVINGIAVVKSKTFSSVSRRQRKGVLDTLNVNMMLIESIDYDDGD